MKTLPEHIQRWRTAHHIALESLRAPGCTKSGLQLWRALRRLENLANRGSVARCNGEHFSFVQGYANSRSSGQVSHQFPFNGAKGEEAWERFTDIIKERVRNIFGRLPDGFFINGDPRGYALKLDNDKATIPDGLHRDFGGYGILAAEID